jgi:sialidase-1
MSVAVLGTLVGLTAWAGQAPVFEQGVVFKSGNGGYHTYRIPALTVTRKGTLLAFAEARRDGAGDSGLIRTVVRRSTDNGRTWSDQVVVADVGDSTTGNPAPVLDRKSGTMWLLLTANPADTEERKILAGDGSGKTRTVWVTHSTDDGVTWAPPSEITRSVKLPNWTWYATGPGNGIQLKDGRLIIPCNHAVAGSPVISSHVIFSDDGGRSWQRGGTLAPRTDEAAVVELPAGGTLLINMRQNSRKGMRAIATSNDRGATWSEVTYDQNLPEPTCQGSLVSFLRPGKAAPTPKLLFSNPADSAKRIRMTVRLSEDGGKAWPVSRMVHPGPSGYSSLAVLRDGSIGLLFERGESVYHETIAFVRLNAAWLRAK